MTPLLPILAFATLTSAAVTPGLTTPTSGASPAATTSTPTAVPGSPTFAPSPRPTALRSTPQPSVSPAPAAPVDPTPVADDAHDDDGAESAMPPAEAPTELPAGAVRAFRTPDRAEPPPFVAPRLELPAETDDGPLDEPAPEAMPSPDQPYVATVTFRAVAATEVDGFDLLIFYPRAAGDFVGTRNGVECRKTGDGMLFADDYEDGKLRVLVASPGPLAFPLDVVCRFTVEPNATLHARLIAVNVTEVTTAKQRADPSVLGVSVLAR